MRIGLFGLPTAGKTYILDRIDFLTVLAGGKLLRQIDPDFDKRDEFGREAARKAAANYVLSSDNFIMDGHYAFGDEIAFTEEEGRMYETYLYLYIKPEILEHRLSLSERNKKWLKFDIKVWQDLEISKLREYCHANNKDFYVIDNPPTFESEDISNVIEFIRDITKGYSCYSFAEKCAKQIIETTTKDSITLFDGDKTLIIEDSSNAAFGYKTHLFDGNFYTGYQVWKQYKEFKQYTIPNLDNLHVTSNKSVADNISDSSYILSSGNKEVWKSISNKMNLPFFGGVEMSAETKFFITKLLQNNGKTVKAYGDSMSDYYMLRQADQGYLVLKSDGRVSRSLKNMCLDGFNYVRN